MTLGEENGPLVTQNVDTRLKLDITYVIFKLNNTLQSGESDKTVFHFEI